MPRGLEWTERIIKSRKKILNSSSKQLVRAEHSIIFNVVLLRVFYISMKIIRVDYHYLFCSLDYLRQIVIPRRRLYFMRRVNFVFNHLKLQCVILGFIM